MTAQTVGQQWLDAGFFLWLPGLADFGFGRLGEALRWGLPAQDTP
jgi:hypothetical protein